MKLKGILGAGTGKLGSSVFSVAAGQQIVRQYQPVVANPNTQAQVDSRAKLKLMSQLAADLAPVIVIPKQGLTSARNLFIKKNYEMANAVEGSAQIVASGVQLTDGNREFGSLQVRASDNDLSMSVLDPLNVDRIVYSVFKRGTDGRLSYVTSNVVSKTEGNENYSVSLERPSGQLVVYAYGMSDLNASATAKYANLNIATAADVAKLVATRTLSSSDYRFSGTAGVGITEDNQTITPGAGGDATITVTAGPNGSVTGGGTFPIGSQVTFTATPNSDYEVDAWRLGAAVVKEESTTLTITVTGNADYSVTFKELAPGS